MKTFIIEQYEIHSQQYSVEAENVEQALEKLQSMDCLLIDNTLEFIEIPEDAGVSMEEIHELFPEVVENNRKLTYEVDDYLSSIRSIEEQ